MILRFRDGGTRLIIKPEQKPGLDGVLWTQPTLWEDDRTQMLRREQEAALLQVSTEKIAAWPVRIPSHAWIDCTDRYTRAADEGLAVILHSADGSVGFPTLTLNYYTPKRSTDPEVSRDDQQNTHAKDWRSARDTWKVAGQQPTILRLDSENELGRTRLREEWFVTPSWVGNQQVMLEVPDNSMFVPFDFTRGLEWYEVQLIDEQHEILSESRQRAVLQMVGTEAMVIHLRPRRIRFIAQAMARFMYVTPFESAYNDEYFITSGWMRLPFYPTRHDIKNTAGRHDIWHEWFSTWMSLDYGINEWWSTSKGGSRLRTEIINQQWFSLCMAYVLVFVSSTMLTLQREPPQVGETVAVLEIHDTALDSVGGIYRVIQTANLDQVYPRTSIGVFYGDPAQ